ncbi:MAG: GIN domain-containing protein [Saprospiraceae bacterium]
MNKILNINLGGYALTIDDDAFEHISAYLESIRQRFSESEGRDEIMRDIESRLGEIITNGLGNRTIVMLPDVEAAIEVMGKPEDFGGEPIQKPGSDKSAKRIITPGKKLYRDEQDAVIGGVCSGMAAYFGFQETVWMRLIFVLLALVSFGFWVPAYLLLWILVQPARTAAERLAMRGETPNVENIAREIEQGAERISKKVNEFGSKNFGNNVSRNSAAVASGCLTVVGKLLLGFVIFIAISMIFGLGTAWVAGIMAFFTAQPYISYFSPLPTSATYLGFFNGFFLLGIPIVALVLWLGRTIFKFKSPAWLGSGMSIFWVLNFVSLVLLGGLAFTGFRQSGSVSKNVDLTSIGSDTLRVQWAGRSVSDDDRDWFMDDDDIRIGNNRLDINDMVKIRVRRSETGRFEYTQTVRARGSNGEEAVENAASTNFDVRKEGNALFIPSGFFLNQGKKWRVQEVRITISVPEGKFITFGDIINRRVYEVDYDDHDDENSIRYNPDKVFRMTSKGLICNDCPQFGDSNYQGDRSYEDFILEGNFETEIIHDDNFSIVIDGAESDRNGLETIRAGDNLTLTTKGKNLAGTVRCTIRTPTFTALVADNSSNVTIRGFDEHRASITAKGQSRVRGLFDANNIDLNLMGKCWVELTGNSDDLNASLADGAELEASGWRTRRAEISAADASRVRLNVTEYANVKADPSSTVKVTGTANVEHQ